MVIGAWMEESSFRTMELTGGGGATCLHTQKEGEGRRCAGTWVGSRTRVDPTHFAFKGFAPFTSIIHVSLFTLSMGEIMENETEELPFLVAREQPLDPFTIDYFVNGVSRGRLLPPSPCM
ncbi:hypothetical protein EUGRSUZ_G00225 [Eucalyptus grandis]|uniref:Uncharacterized protein n=2 Tax=Eucalyptus grandis TaxID=71139 RepID=A0ACC3JZQ2_EUCGR|nr:hypothetical protein EUGRSUZ_G00225 [Eucalyptus grandis]